MQKYVIALYIRLSIEDYKYDSLSIENQSLVLHEYAASMPEALNAEIMEFIDNGYSGTNFERPQVQKLIEMVRANQIDCIIVKDFSRFGGFLHDVQKPLSGRSVPRPIGLDDRGADVRAAQEILHDLRGYAGVNFKDGDSGVQILADP